MAEPLDLRVEECLCGGAIVSAPEPDRWADAVLMHNRTFLHRRWRQRREGGVAVVPGTVACRISGCPTRISEEAGRDICRFHQADELRSANPEA